MPTTFRTGHSGDASTMFFVVLQPGYSISIRQTRNSFDSEVLVLWSQSCPASYRSGTRITSFDDPDTRAVSTANSASGPRKLWFVVHGHSGGHGTFTLSWTITSPPTRSPTRAGQTWAPTGE